MSSKTHSAGVAGANRIERGSLALLEDDDLARLDVAHVLGADDVEAGRLGAQAPAVGGHRVGRPELGRAAGVVGGRQAAEDERAGTRTGRGSR